MMKQYKLGILLALTLLLALPVGAVSEGYENFKADRAYENQFTDVVSGAWYEEYIIITYELGLMNGESETRFDISGNITYAETLTLAARLHQMYHQGTNEFGTSDIAWYVPYVEYAIQHNIISFPIFDYTAPITRGEFAEIISKSVPAFSEKYSFQPGDIPDVSSSAPYADAVYSLYNAGILAGSDSAGTFHPNNNISRSEVSAIISRVTQIEMRL